MDVSSKLTYEQPFNECIRVCLRLEQLFQAIDYQLMDLSILGTRHTIHLIINLLLVLDRPDLKSKLAKELNNYLRNFSQHHDTNVKEERLKYITQQLHQYSHSLIENSEKIGYRLRDIELLNMLRLHLASPGGGCSFDLPQYYYWLNQSEELRRTTIISWLKEFSEIRAIIELLLELLRYQNNSEEKQAINGNYQELLNPQNKIRMLRVTLDKQIEAYPEMSIGRHFLSIRFFSPMFEKRSVQYTGNINFLLSYCNL